MKLFILAIVTFGAIGLFTACEKPDYQHPGHRSAK